MNYVFLQARKIIRFSSFINVLSTLYLRVKHYDLFWLGKTMSLLDYMTKQECTDTYRSWWHDLWSLSAPAMVLLSLQPSLRVLEHQVWSCASQLVKTTINYYKNKKQLLLLLKTSSHFLLGLNINTDKAWARNLLVPFRENDLAHFPYLSYSDLVFTWFSIFRVQFSKVQSNLN